MNIKESLDRAQKSLAEIQQALPKKQAKASIFDGVDDCCAGESNDYLSSRLDWLRQDLNYLQSSFYDHLQGHIPKINGAAAMTKALKALGLGDDYQVVPQTIYASDGTIERTDYLLKQNAPV